ncbi:MAG: PQQ-binding-like beta-propeller repeat protein [Planctomycetaceae bacterium]|nr:PQQ-binding-like beta-propeller repeat protein [Planctomycetaceae bacterium]
MIRSTLILFVLICSTSTGVGDDWLQFRGADGQGASAEKGLPQVWNSQENLVWKSALPGFGSSSPIILGDQIYLTCYSGYGIDREAEEQMSDLRLHLLCFSLSDGSLRWQQSVQPELPESERVRDHGYAAATPVTDGERIFVFFGKTGVLAFDLDGKQLWQTSVGTETHGWGCGTSPVLYQDLVIVNASVESKSLVALNKETGEEVWRAGGMKQSWNTPHLVKLENGKQELVVNVIDQILAFDPATGESLWECEGISDYVCPSVISQDEIVYVIGGRRSRAIAVRAGGRGDVTESHKLWEAQAGANVSSPVIHGDHLYWVSDRNRTAYCLDRNSGEVIYQKRFGGQPYASTVVGDDKLYVVTRYSGTFVLAAKPEFEILAHNQFDDESTFNASPAIAAGKLLIRSDEHLYCIE